MVKYIHLPSGKQSQSYGKTLFLVGNTTMNMFRSRLLDYQRAIHCVAPPCAGHAVGCDCCDPLFPPAEMAYGEDRDEN